MLQKINEHMSKVIYVFHLRRTISKYFRGILPFAAIHVVRWGPDGFVLPVCIASGQKIGLNTSVGLEKYEPMPC